MEQKIEEQNELFNRIFNNKENINDDDYLQINNKLHKIIKENRELYKENKNKSDVLDVINQRCKNLENDNGKLLNLNVELCKIIKKLKSNESSQIQSFQTVSNDDEKHCYCSSKWNFSITSTKYIFDYADYFCMDNLKHCDNFKELYKHCPLMENIFGKSNASFVEEAIYKDYDSSYVKMIIKILLLFIKDFKEAYNKTVIILITFDFLLRNINFVIEKENQIFAKIVLKKFEEFSNDNIIFMPIAESYNIDFNKWYKTIKDIITN